MINKIIFWFKKEFSVLTIEECKSLNLEWCHNIYGDYINHINCRSIWRDKNNKSFRCCSLCNEKGNYLNYRWWYLRFRVECVKYFNVDYVICNISDTFSPLYKHYYEENLTPKEASKILYATKKEEWNRRENSN